MVSQIIISGIDATANAVAFAPPITNGLVGWWHIGGSAAASVPNLAAPGDTASVIGPPTFSPGYASFVGNTQYLQTTLADTTECTFITVSRSSDTFLANHRPQLLGCYSAIGAQFYGCQIAVTGTPNAAPNATITVIGGRDDGSGGSVQRGIALTVNNFNQWKFLAGVVTAGVGTPDGRQIYNKTDGTSGIASATSARILHPSLKWQLGAASSSLVIGTGDAAVQAIYNRVLSVDEIEELYQFVKYRLNALFGIVV